MTFVKTLAVFASLTFSLASSAARTNDDASASIIEVTGLYCGASACRVYSLERAMVRGTVIRVTACPLETGGETPKCYVTIVRDETHGSDAEALDQFHKWLERQDD